MVKSRIFVRKLLSQSLILTFYERNAITSAVLPYGTVPGHGPQMVRLLLVFTYICQEDVAKIL